MTVIEQWRHPTLNIPIIKFIEEYNYGFYR